MKRSISLFLTLAVFATLLVTASANGGSLTIVSDTSVTVYGPVYEYEGLGGDWGDGKDAVPSFIHGLWPAPPAGVTWISTAYCPEDAVKDSWRKYEKSFELCQGAYDTSGTVWVNSDNAEETYFNGSLVGTDGTMLGAPSGKRAWETVSTYTIAPVAGTNTFAFISRNYSQPDGTCSSNPTALWFKTEIEYSCPIIVDIDIKPGSYPNCFNNNGNGVIPVAVLGSAEFDVSQIDVATIALDGLSVATRGKENKLLAAYEDVNKDGYTDLVVKIEDVDGTFSQGSGTATLTGNLLAQFGGTRFQGTDTICVTQ
jgi:hypothetical protein